MFFYVADEVFLGSHLELEEVADANAVGVRLRCALMLYYDVIHVTSPDREESNTVFTAIKHEFDVVLVVSYLTFI